MSEKSNICGGCTACCDLFPVKTLEKPPNTKCEHCDGGCLIHPTRPQECRDFDCMWLQSKAPIAIRPDNCGIVFEKLSDRIIYGTVFKPITSDGAAQVYAFVQQGFSVFLSKNDDASSRTFINENHNETNILKEFQQHLEARYGHIRN